MVLTKDELLARLRNEVDILLHLTSKVDPAKLDYRPTAGQRSTLELLQYLAIMGPIHVRAAVARAFDMEEWRAAWEAGKAAASAMDLEQIKNAIAGQPAAFAELMGSCSDADFRQEIELFGQKASRGSWIVFLVLCHYAAYRMQLFLYVKASGREELSTLNLWLGKDAV